MEKICTMALAATLTLTASAQSRQKAAGNVPQSFQTEETRTSLKSATRLAPKAGIADVAGDYEWSYYGLLTNDQGNNSAIVKIAVSNASTGEITISDMVAAGTGITTPVKATVDLSKGTVTLPNKQNLGQDSYGDTNYFYIKSLDSEGKLVDGAYDGESIVGTISGQTITFSEDYVFAVGDYTNEDLGWWKLTALNKFTVYVEPDNEIKLEEWTEITTGTMIDGWILTGMKNGGNYVDINNYPLNVKIARNNENPNLLLIEDPYVQAISGFPSSGASGYIVIDVTDPTFVLVNPGVFSGFSNGSNKVCCTNVEGFYVGQGYSKDVIQSSLSGDIPVWSTLTTDAAGNTVIDIPNCRFQYTSELSKIYSWTDRADAMKAKIVFKDDAAGNGSINGITYLLSEEEGTAQVTGCDDSLTNLAIPETITSGDKTYTVTSVAENAFLNNKTITSITIPETMKSVARDAFRNMSGLQTLYTEDLAAWCGIEFENALANPIYNLCSNSNETKWGKFLVTNVNDANTADFTNLIIPEGVTTMTRSFYGYKALKSVTLPSTLTTLGDQTFASCNGLTEVVVPEGVITIGSAFFGCENLKSVTLPSTLETLGNNAFYENKALEEIELPAGLKTIGLMAFYSCSGLKKITSNAEEPAEAKLLAFDGVATDIPVYVPAASIEAYKAAAEWKDFTNYLAIPGSAVIELDADNAADVEYFNLQGVKIANPENGVFIRRQGDKVNKVVVK
ncbi:MAG: leucine-rich repeat domain-containing protein [Muribaculaceae bacterium]|nr:leucine-rich repeat domain-containing protein [Muribaculaceae bacterium]